MNKTETQSALDALKICYEHCRVYHPEVERNNVGESVRAAIALCEASLARVVEPVAQVDAIMKLADAYAEASFDQGLNRVTVTPEPEDRRAELLAAVNAVATPQAAAQPSQAVKSTRCPEKLKPGGCQLHNLHCGWPKCNEGGAT